MKKNAILIVSLIILLVSVAADRPPTKIWEYAFPFQIDNQGTVQDGRGGIVVRGGTNNAIFWFDSRGTPVEISVGSNSNLWPIACTSIRLIAGVSSTNGGFHYNLRRYKRDGTYTESPEPFGYAMYPTVQPNDALGCFLISPDSTKLIRIRY